MKKQATLLLMAILLLQSVVVHPVSALVPKYARISSVILGLGDKVVLGPYNITFSSVTPQWDKVYITIAGPKKVVYGVVGQSGTICYPTNGTNKLLEVTVDVIWANKKSIILRINSPLIKLYPEKTINVGDEFTLPKGLPHIKVKLESSSSTEAVFLVTTPYGRKYLNVEKGKAKGISYKLDSGHSYSNYMVIEVLNCTKDYAVVNVYVPRVASVNFRIVKHKEASGEKPKPSNLIPIYSDILYTGEKLPVEYNGTHYYFELLSVIPDVVKVKVYEGKSVIGTYTLDVGDIPKAVDGTPFLLAVQKTDPEYKRAIIRIYGPSGAGVTPILRPAKVVANITAVPTTVLLGQDIVLSIGVENLGRGDAHHLNVAAPIPNGFELVSMTKSWQIKNLPAFTKLPILVYVLRPTKVGKFDIGKVIVTYYDDESLETGKMKTIYSAPLTGIIVYNIPKLSIGGSAYNGTWGEYVTTKVNETVKVKLTVTAAKGNPSYEFIKNATLHLELPKGLTGPSTVKLGDVKAGESKTVTLNLKVTKEALLNVRALLTYQDPIGRAHQLSTGNLVTINSVPPQVIVKKVKVWPQPEELPDYINKTLSNMDDPRPLAEEIIEVASHYIPPKTNLWKLTTVVFIVTTVLLAGLAYNYYAQFEKLKEKVLRKKQRRPGGLPKKEEESEL